MKIFIMTDMEGCAGVANAEHYTTPERRYYEHACELATLEASAAVEGALEAGATEVLVVDGHGPGAMKRSLLHPHALLLTGRPLPPGFGWNMDGTFNAAMIIGQHAKSNTDGGHLAHTGSFGVEEQLLNGLSVGEMALVMLRAGYFGVPTVLVSGDQAACDEATALVPDIEVATVKWGVSRGSAKGLTGEENRRFNCAATHLHPDRARALIRERAYRAVKRIPEIAPLRMDPPYTLVMAIRPEKGRKKGKTITLKAKDFIDLMALRNTLPARRSPARPKTAPRKKEAAKGARKAAKKTQRKKR